jgi:hypothetical protein
MHNRSIPVIFGFPLVLQTLTCKGLLSEEAPQFSYPETLKALLLFIILFV